MKENKYKENTEMIKNIISELIIISSYIPTKIYSNGRRILSIQPLTHDLVVDYLRDMIHEPEKGIKGYNFLNHLVDSRFDFKTLSLWQKITLYAMGQFKRTYRQNY